MLKCHDPRQTDKYNHLSGPKKIPVVEWKTPPSKEDLEKHFSQFHFGWVKDSTLAETDTGAKPGDTPPPQPPLQEVMKN